MRLLLPFIMAIPLLLRSGAAEATDPRMLAETGAFLLGNAQRCGVSAERVIDAGNVILGMIAAVSTNAGQEQAAYSRFQKMFLLKLASSLGVDISGRAAV